MLRHGRSDEGCGESCEISAGLYIKIEGARLRNGLTTDTPIKVRRPRSANDGDARSAVINKM